MKKSTEATVIDGEWMTLAEAVRKLQKSQSTVERLVGSGALKSKLDPRPGRKPERLYSAEDVHRLARGDEATSRSLSVVKPPAETHLAIAPDVISAACEVMTEWRNTPAPIPVTVKLWLTIDEAQAYSGRSRNRILQWCKDGRITAERDGGWRIHRASLEAYAG